MKKKHNEGATKEPGAPSTIMIVEDNEALAHLIQKRLEDLEFSTTLASDGKEAITWTVDHPGSLLLLDYRLPDMTGKEVIESLAEKQCRVPFIVITGHGDEKAAVEMMKLGARDYLVKEEGFLDLVSQVVKRVVDQFVTEKNLADAQEKLLFTQFFAEHAGDAVYWMTRDGQFVFVNDAACRALGYDRNELLSMSVPDIDPLFPGQKFTEIWEVGKREKVFRLESSHRRKDGTVFPVEIMANYMEYNGEEYTCVIARDITKRRRGEEALKESEKKYRHLVDNALVGVFSTNLKGEVHYVNEASLRMFEFNSLDELISDGALARYKNPKDREVLTQNLRRKGRVDNLELELLTKTGKTRNVLVNATLDGDIMSGMVMDVTERKLAEEELGKSYRELQLLEEINRDTLTGKPFDKIIKKVIRAFAEMCHAKGLTVYFYDRQTHRLVPQNTGTDEVTLRRIKKLARIDPMDYAPLLRNGYRFYEALKSGRSFITSDPEEIAALYAEYTDSEALKKLIRPVMKLLGTKIIGAIPLISSEGPLGLITFNTDTRPSEEDLHRMERFGNQVASTLVRVKAEEQLRKLSQAVEQSPASVIIMDIQGNIRYANPKFTEVTGYSVEEVVGKSPCILRSGDTSWKARQELRETITSGEEWQGECHNRKKNGELYWAFASISPIRDSEGRITHFLGIEEDITGRKEAEDRMRHRLAIEEAVAHASRLLMSPEGAELNEVLKILGEAVGANRAHIFRLRENGKKMRIIHEWCDAQTVGIIQDVKDVETTRWPWWMMRLENDEDIVIQDVKALPDQAATERKGFEAENVRSVLAVPIYSTGGRLVAFIGFDDTEKCRDWPSEDVRALRVVGEMIALCWERLSAEEALRESQKQLRELAVHIESVREDERTQIAREIHDELGQALTGLKMDLAWMENRFPEDEEGLSQKTNSMKELIDSTIQTVRRISSELRPGILDDLGLTAAIEWEAQWFKERTGIEYELTIDPQNVAPDEKYSTTLFRILQEALTNVARHASASTVYISLTKRDDDLMLVIKDNGRGITESEITDSKSFGLMSIRERAFLLGGDVEITGIRGKGSTVTITVPFESK